MSIVAVSARIFDRSSPSLVRQPPPPEARPHGRPVGPPAPPSIRACGEMPHAGPASSTVVRRNVGVPVGRPSSARRRRSARSRARPLRRLGSRARVSRRSGPCAPRTHSRRPSRSRPAVSAAHLCGQGGLGRREHRRSLGRQRIHIRHLHVSSQPEAMRHELRRDRLGVQARVLDALRTLPERIHGPVDGRLELLGPERKQQGQDRVLQQPRLHQIRAGDVERS